MGKVKIRIRYQAWPVSLYPWEIYADGRRVAACAYPIAARARAAAIRGDLAEVVRWHRALQEQARTGEMIGGYNQLRGAVADFHGLDLRGTDFTGADLGPVLIRCWHLYPEGANFRGADCRGVSFRNARLGYASFAHADLRGADFTGADLRYASFFKTRVEGAKGLPEDANGK